MREGRQTSPPQSNFLHAARVENNKNNLAHPDHCPENPNWSQTGCLDMPIEVKEQDASAKISDLESFQSIIPCGFEGRNSQ
ncbi:hypothetical protein E2C01_063566 [Portunus trituberculatus]|uniref:Uncharacterized protein n=1 Tax=Portunus trituberculatus TaxID=210409 RepID=A0A5B7HGP6_PORTR|nr:hypothetical protein [Portunus trituberculatus]